LRELREELGVGPESLSGLKAGGNVRVRDVGLAFLVTPFSAEVSSPEVSLLEEHEECRWVEPGEIRKMRTVPMLFEAYISATAQYDKQ